MTGEQLIARAAAAGERRCSAVKSRIVRSAREAGVAARIVDGGIALSAPGLAKRWLDDPRLRFLGWAR